MKDGKIRRHHFLIAIMAFGIVGCNESALDRCISSKMAVWDQDNPSGVKVIRVCENEDGSWCWAPEDSPDLTEKEWTRVQQVERVTDQCILLTKNA